MSLNRTILVVRRCTTTLKPLMNLRLPLGRSQKAGSSTATTSTPQSEEGGEEAKSDGENPPADNAEEGNDDAEDSGDNDTEAEESGLTLNEKGNPSRSIPEEPKIQINARMKYQSSKGSSRATTCIGWTRFQTNTTGRWVLMGGDYTVLTQTTEYDYRIDAMKGIRKLSIEEKLMHFQWMENIIAEDKEGVEWVTGRKLIYKASLNFLAKSWWSIV
ncbi:hypothetical protein HAX54_045095 [Datura stramonium]|uniref:Uncharacterized protein n=1 Tax=Datura stramonium TaxID=4076 RepID=A0ABS8SQF2_DATST|nr:hypothetical protein [Datura stramonium]